MFIYFWEREWERDRALVGEKQRKGDTESEAGSRLSAVSTEPDAGLQLKYHKIMTWSDVGRLTEWDTQAPLLFYFYIFIIILVRMLEKLDITSNYSLSIIISFCNTGKL